MGKKVGLSDPLYWILSAASPVLSSWVLLPYHSSTCENLQTPKKGALEAGADVED